MSEVRPSSGVGECGIRRRFQRVGGHPTDGFHEWGATPASSLRRCHVRCVRGTPMPVAMTGRLATDAARGCGRHGGMGSARGSDTLDCSVAQSL
eukprot:5309051-Prymnesium_polylepis.1